MRLLESDQQPSWNAELICRQSSLGAVVVTAIYFPLLVAAPAAGWYFGVLPSWVAALVGLVGLLFVWGMFNIFRATLRPTNWYLAIEPDGLLINLRSYRNFQLPPGQTVLHLDFKDIINVKRYVARVNLPSDDGTMTWREQSLDLQIQPELSESVRQAISVERQRRFVRRYFGNAICVSGRANHVPVTVPQQGVIRIGWRTRYDGVRPPIKNVLQHLASRVERIAADATETIPNWETSSDAELDELILRLIETNDVINAVKVLVQRRGYSTTEAKRFVDEIGVRV